MERKAVYPVILERDGDGYFVRIPDFDICTQGSSIVDGIEMARDAIGLMGIDFEDEGKNVPKPFSVAYEKGTEEIETLVDIDFSEYRKRVDNKAVKKNCTIPYWMSVEADKAGINYSRVLQEALENILKVQNSI